MTQLFAMEGIGKQYGSKLVLQDIDLAIDHGESVAVVGESGAGKSTLSRIMLRLTRPTAGRYLFDGQDVFKLSGPALKRWRLDVQAVFQSSLMSLNPRLTVERLVTEPIEVAQGLRRRDRAAKAAELLEVVGLAGRLRSRFPHQLSGGQRQRVAVARAISTRPRFLVLDEPVSALDVSIRAQILNLLKDIKEEFGMTFAYITHDLATVRHLCDRAYVLYGGLIFEELGAEQLCTQPDNPYTAMLLQSVLAVGRYAALDTWQGTITTSQDGAACAFADRCLHVQAECLNVRPELNSVAPGWRSRCHFAGQVKPARSSAVQN